jgi:hypothetical protein
VSLSYTTACWTVRLLACVSFKFIPPLMLDAERSCGVSQAFCA